MTFPSFQKYLLAVTASVVACAAGVQAQRPGTIFCESGFLADESSFEADATVLRSPESFSVASLVDAAADVNSPYYLLDEPSAGSDMYSKSWKVYNSEPVVDLLRKVGVCETCSEAGLVENGFEVEVLAILITMYPPTLDVIEAKVRDPNYPACRDYTDSPTFTPTPNPSASPTTGKPTTPPSPAPTEAPTSNPTKTPTPEPTPGPTGAPTSGPTELPTASPTWGGPSASPSISPLDCSEYQETYVSSELPLTIHYVVDTTVASAATFSAQVVFEGKGWIGFGMSPNGAMNGTMAIVGLPEEDQSATNPGKYYLGGNSQNFINLVDEQTLANSSIVQNKSHTILSFSKYLEEEGETAIDGNGANTFVVALGRDNDFAYHESKAIFELALTPCISGAVEDFNNVVTVSETAPNDEISNFPGDVRPLGEATAGEIPSTVIVEDSTTTGTSDSTSNSTSDSTSDSTTVDTTSDSNSGNANSTDNSGSSNNDENSDVPGFDLSQGQTDGRPGSEPYRPADAWEVQQKLDDRDDPLMASGAASWTFQVSALIGVLCLLVIA